MINTRKASLVSACVDDPADGDLVYRHGFNATGWYLDDAKNELVESIEARIDQFKVGSTQLLYERRDVFEVFPDTVSRCGFEFLCSIPEKFRDRATTQVEIVAKYRDGSLIPIKNLWLRFSVIDYRTQDHGDMMTEDFTRVLHRNDVYGGGPPSALADPRCLALIRRYIDLSDNVLDIGCGIGAYGKVLLPSGVRWHGVEVVSDFCARMSAEGLPNTLASGLALPFPDGSFASAISIEVLEHIDDYRAFLSEIARVVRGTVCFSVPNAEGIPLMAPMNALPWHMLESDHKNFFTRGSIRQLLRLYFDEVEVFTYGDLPKVLSYDGLPIPNHLFAVASKARR